MFRLSNSLIGLLNILSILVSLPIIGAGILFGLKSATECQRFLHSPFFFFGIFLLVVSLFGLVGACCRSNLLLWIYLLVMFVLVAGLLAFTVFAFVVTNKGIGTAIDGREFLEYRLTDYSGWLRKWVSEKENWAKVRSCFQDAMVCGGFEGDQLLKATAFYKEHLSPIQSGCCKPPTHCGYTFQNATYWTIPKSGLASKLDSDCSSWSNDQGMLCFSCSACKAGFLANVKIQWKKLAVFNVILIVFLTVVYAVGCCALRNNRSVRYHPYRGYR